MIRTFATVILDHSPFSLRFWCIFSFTSSPIKLCKTSYYYRWDVWVYLFKYTPRGNYKLSSLQKGLLQKGLLHLGLTPLIPPTKRPPYENVSFKTHFKPSFSNKGSILDYLMNISLFISSCIFIFTFLYVFVKVFMNISGCVITLLGLRSLCLKFGLKMMTFD